METWNVHKVCKQGSAGERYSLEDWKWCVNPFQLTEQDVWEETCSDLFVPCG